MNLYRRLTITMALLLALGLAVADVVTYTSLRSFLYGRLDAQVESSQRLADRYLVYQALRGRPATAEGLDQRVSPDVYVLVLARDGTISISLPSGSPDNPDPQPVIPKAVRTQILPEPQKFGRYQGAYRPNPYGFNLNGPAGSAAHYRAQALAVPEGTLVTAISLNPTDATLSSLLRVELLVSLAVIVALCILALWTVRRGLRPLEAMTATARAIASGDLTRRVDTEDASTEVGRLGTALNGMLSRIEVAFDQKSESEARLRQFVADASHELRTPLTSIRGYAELLRRGGFEEESDRRRALVRIEREAARMGGLVDDLLLLARLDQGRPLEKTEVDLYRTCRDAVEDARAMAPDRAIELGGTATVVVAGDRDRLAQVAHNLIRNAVSHTPPGSPIWVTVSAEGTMGVLRVRDEGRGLSARQAERVFDRFYRGDSARTGEGTGLGLSIVRAIAVALGGEAGASSTPGTGAVFTVAIPLVPLHQREARRPPAPQRSDGPRRPEYTS